MIDILCYFLIGQKDGRVWPVYSEIYTVTAQWPLLRKSKLEHKNQFTLLRFILT